MGFITEIPVTLAPGEAARRLGAALTARLGGRLRRGIAVAAVLRGQPAGRSWGVVPPG